jgi:hypothetical protein
MILPVVDWNALWLQAQPLLLWVFGMVVYAIFIFSFYERVSRRLIFAFEVKGKATQGFGLFWARTVYGLKYIFFAPLFLFGWFALLAGLILVMQAAMPLEEGLLIGMAMLATIRVCAYYREQLAEDLAKILPLALLGIFILDRSGVDLAGFMTKLGDLPVLFGTLAVYFGFMVVLELLLRVYDAIVNRE